jgi:hypothetical protein
MAVQHFRENLEPVGVSSLPWRYAAGLESTAVQFGVHSVPGLRAHVAVTGVACGELRVGVGPGLGFG